MQGTSEECSNSLNAICEVGRAFAVDETSHTRVQFLLALGAYDKTQPLRYRAGWAALLEALPPLAILKDVRRRSETLSIARMLVRNDGIPTEVFERFDYQRLIQISRLSPPIQQEMFRREVDSECALRPSILGYIHLQKLTLIIARELGVPSRPSLWKEVSSQNP